MILDAMPDPDALEAVIWELMEEPDLGVFGEVPSALLAGAGAQRLLAGQACGATVKIWHSLELNREARLKRVVAALLGLGIRAGWMAAQEKCDPLKGSDSRSRLTR